MFGSTTRIGLKLLKNAILLVVILTSSNSNAVAQSKTVSDYVKALVDGDIQKAESFWLPSVIADSRRMEISYNDVPAKFDCTSIVVQKLNDIRSKAAKVIVGKPEEFDGYYKMPVTLVYSTNKETCDYFAVPYFGKWLIADRSYIFARSWPVLGTKYVDLHIGDSTKVNDFALQAMDDFIEQTARKLGATEKDLDRLKAQRIEYYLCGEDQIDSLTGYKTEGMYDLPLDYVYSRHLPHQHELVHLLVNYKLQSLPMYTLPVVQEGLAVALGGRWGKAPKVVLQLGDILIENGFVDANKLITYDGFYTGAGSTDMSYPVAGLLMDMILSEYGMDKTLDLYRAVSGNQSQVMAMDADDFRRNKVPAALGVSYNDVIGAFDKYRAKYGTYGIVPGVGDSDNKNDMNFKGKGWKLNINAYADNYGVDFHGPDSLICTVLLSNGKKAVQKTYKSWMFAEQNSEREYNGERYGIIFSGAEAGLYDYYLNCLMAKYVYGFTPDSSYVSQDGSTVTFKLEKSLIDKPIDDFDVSVMVH